MLVVSLIAHIVAAWVSPILDADEVFNYWEPLHFLIYGTGQQTWEHSPEFALRSYLYLLIHAGPVYILKVIGLDQAVVFSLLRVALGVFSAICKHKFLKSLEIGRIEYALVLITTGMTMASHCFLTNTFSMNMICLGLGWFLDFYENGQYRYLFSSLLVCSLAVFLGWPFVIVIIGLVALVYLYKKASWVLSWRLWILGIVSILLVVVPSFIVDTHFYGRPTFTILNLIGYNSSVSTSNFTGRAALFGEEPWYFYIVNLLLNMNFLFICWLLSPLYLIYSYLSKSYIKRYYCYVGMTISTLVWLVFMSSQRHKEERYMFVIYPFILAVSLQVLSRFPKNIAKLLIISSIIISTSRTAQLIRVYSGPFELWDYDFQDSTVCVGIDWYMFHSSFYLKNGNLQYIDDGFKGILPQAFTDTSIVPKNMNDENRPEPSRYVDLKTCDYFVTLIIQSKPLRKELKAFPIVKEVKFIDRLETPQPYRSLYLPLTNKEVFGRYVIIKRKQSN